MGELFGAFGIEWQLLLAQAVNFAIVFGALTYFLYKPILKLLADRQAKITKGIKDAELAEKAATENEGARSSIISSAHKDAEAIVSHAEDEGKREKNEIVKAAQGRADSVLEDARAQAEEMKRRAAAESEKEVARVAVLAAEKILKEQS